MIAAVTMSVGLEVKRSEEMLKVYLLNERKRYQSLLLKLRETEIIVENLESKLEETERKCEILEEENNNLINMVQEVVLFEKEKLKRSMNVVENEKKNHLESRRK